MPHSTKPQEKWESTVLPVAVVVYARVQSEDMKSAVLHKSVVGMSAVYCNEVGMHLSIAHKFW